MPCATFCVSCATRFQKRAVFVEECHCATVFRETVSCGTIALSRKRGVVAKIRSAQFWHGL